MNKMIEIGGGVMLQRITAAIRTFGKVLIEVDSAAHKTLRATIGIRTFCFARWTAARLNPLLCANQCFYAAYYDHLWFHDVFLVSRCLGPSVIRSPDLVQRYSAKGLGPCLEAIRCRSKHEREWD